MMKWFDSHCHVDEEAFDEDREEALARMAEHGITRYAVIGSDMETSRRAIRFAREHAGAIAVGGIHPHEAKGFREEDLAEIRGYVEEYCQLFGCDVSEVMDSPFTVVTPDSRNPYKQLYVAN